MSTVTLSNVNRQADRLSNSTFGPQKSTQLTEAIARGLPQYRDAARGDWRTGSAAKTAARPRPCGWASAITCLGRYRQAIETLKTGDGGALAHFYHGQVPSTRTNHHDEAITASRSGERPATTATTVPWPRPKRCATAVTRQGAARSARQALRARSSKRPNTCISAAPRSPRWAAIRAKSSPCTSGPSKSDGRHAGALFGLALENDRRGNDETRAAAYTSEPLAFPAHVGALLNLGILYEDSTQYDRAQQCYQRMLDTFPDHPRARLFCKDVAASGDMFYDEDAQRRQRPPGPGAQRLRSPISSFRSAAATACRRWASRRSAT